MDTFMITNKADGLNCITTMKDFVEFTKNVEHIRIYLSFFNFTASQSISADDNNQSDQHNLNKENLILASTYIRIFLYVLVIIISLVGNLLIILVICCNRFMRKSTNYFILNLAVCDLAILFSCVWVHVLLTINKYWILGETFCKINSFLQMVSIIASVLTLSLISCDRYFGIMHPLKSRITSKKSYYFIATIWLISIIISIPTYVYRTYTERKWADFDERHCDDLGWPITLVRDENGCVLKTVRPAKRLYYTTVILLLFFMPIIFMSITYSIIIKKLWSHEIIGEAGSYNKEIVIKKRKRIVIMLVLILAVFFICWGPLESMLLFMEYTQEFPSWWSDLEWISYFLAYSNTAINPFIYAGLSENYKYGFNRLKDRVLGDREKGITISNANSNARLSVPLLRKPPIQIKIIKKSLPNRAECSEF